MPRLRLFAFGLLVLANLFWAGNWVLGRVLRDAFNPIGLNFWRWVIAAAVLAPFALGGVIAKREILRRHARVLLLLAVSGVAIYQSLVYLGLSLTTAINAVLLNSATPMFILLCSWIMERERATVRQIVGLLISLAGIAVIMTRGDPASLLTFELHTGDAWILLAMPFWGIYSVLLKRRPPEIGGLELLFVISVAGVLMLAPFYVLELLVTAPALPSAEAIAGALYIGIFSSVFGFVLWNRAVNVVGANAAGFTLHLLPAFGAGLAIVFLGEEFGAFHAAGIATILAGVLLATTHRSTGWELRSAGRSASR